MFKKARPLVAIDIALCLYAAREYGDRPNNRSRTDLEEDTPFPVFEVLRQLTRPIVSLPRNFMKTCARYPQNMFTHRVGRISAVVSYKLAQNALCGETVFGRYSFY